jgi:hypothetical protein
MPCVACDDVTAPYTRAQVELSVQRDASDPAVLRSMMKEVIHRGAAWVVRAALVTVVMTASQAFG